jgi:hypothetical protein
MDQDDPEKRIADLEQQLGPPPPNAASRTGSGRRFVAYAVPDASRLMLTVGLMLVSAWVVVGVFATLAGPILDAVQFPFVPLAMVAGLGVGSVLILRRLYSKEVGLFVTAGGLTVDGRPGDVFPLRDARLGQWTGWPRRYAPPAQGRALFLTCGPNRFVIGSADRRVTGRVRSNAPQARYSRLDVRMSPQLFDELLDIVGQQRQTTRQSGLPPTQPPRPGPSAAPESRQT